MGISIINAEGSDFEKFRRICMLLKSFDIPAVVMLDSDAKKLDSEIKAVVAKVAGIATRT